MIFKEHFFSEDNSAGSWITFSAGENKTTIVNTCFEKISLFLSFLFFAHSDTDHVTLVRILLIWGPLVQDLLKESFYTVDSFIDPFGPQLVLEMNKPCSWMWSIWNCISAFFSKVQSISAGARVARQLLFFCFFKVYWLQVNPTMQGTQNTFPHLNKLLW